MERIAHDVVQTSDEKLAKVHDVQVRLSTITIVQLTIERISPSIVTAILTNAPSWESRTIEGLDNLYDNSRSAKKRSCWNVISGRAPVELRRAIRLETGRPKLDSARDSEFQ